VTELKTITNQYFQFVHGCATLIALEKTIELKYELLKKVKSCFEDCRILDMPVLHARESVKAVDSRFRDCAIHVDAGDRSYMVSSDVRDMILHNFIHGMRHGDTYASISRVIRPTRARRASLRLPEFQMLNISQFGSLAREPVSAALTGFLQSLGRIFDAWDIRVFMHQNSPKTDAYVIDVDVVGAKDGKKALIGHLTAVDISKRLQRKTQRAHMYDGKYILSFDAGFENLTESLLALGSIKE
jgi:hypothetical protein